MVAGRELDALVAEKVMGLTVKLMYDPGFIDIGPWEKVDGVSDPPDAIEGWCPVADYSTSIAAAWEVWEKLIEDGWYPDLITTYGPGEKTPIYRCELHRGWDGLDDHLVVCADTAPASICLAALAAVGALPPTLEEEEND